MMTPKRRLGGPRLERTWGVGNPESDRELAFRGTSNSKQKEELENPKPQGERKPETSRIREQSATKNVLECARISNRSRYTPQGSLPLWYSQESLDPEHPDGWMPVKRCLWEDAFRDSGASTTIRTKTDVLPEAGGGKLL